MIRRKKTKGEVNPQSFVDDTEHSGGLSEDTPVNVDTPVEIDTAAKEDDSVEADISAKDKELAGESPAESDPLGLNSDDPEFVNLEEEKRSPKKIIIIALAALLLIGAGIFFLYRNIDSGSEGKVYVESVRILGGLGTANGGSNRFTGEVEAQESWKITLEADMSVEECYVKVGDEVKKNDPLFKYNTEELKLNKERKELEMETMQNESNQLTRDISTYQSDLRSASTSEKIELQTQILTAQTTIKKNEYSIKSCKEEIKKIEDNIKDATVKSKMDGVIKKINVALGESSTTDEDSMESEIDNGEDSSVYMTIQSIGDYRIKGKITETNMSDLNEGDQVIVRSRVDDTTWQGHISSIKTDENVQADSGSTDDYGYSDESASETASTYYFYVELNNMDGLLMGQHVFVEVDNGQDDKEGIWISSAYIISEDGEYAVWKDKRGRLEKAVIEIGEYDEELDEYQVLSGITADDYIACDDVELKAGMKTTKVDPYAEEEEDGDSEEGGSGGEDMEEDMGDDMGDMEEDMDDMGDDMEEDMGDMEEGSDGMYDDMGDPMQEPGDSMGEPGMQENQGDFMESGDDIG